MAHCFLPGLASGLLAALLPLAMALSTRLLCVLDELAGVVPPPLPLSESHANLTLVHVMYSSSREYFPALLMSMLSLARHLTAPALCSIHLLVAQEDARQARDLVGCFRQELTLDGNGIPDVKVHVVRPLPFNVHRFRPFNGNPVQSEMLYARLYASDYLPNVKRVLYLDSDVLVRADIAPLYQMHMEHTLAARPTTWLTYLQCWGLQVMNDLPQDFMFNSGVLLLDLERWRSEGVAAAIVELLNETEGCIAEQLAMNVHFRGRFDRLPPHWHMESLGEVPWKRRVAPACRSGILHWTGPNKFWLRERYPDLDFLVRPALPKQRCAALPEDPRELYYPVR